MDFAGLLHALRVDEVGGAPARRVGVLLPLHVAGGREVWVCIDWRKTKAKGGPRRRRIRMKMRHRLRRLAQVRREVRKYRELKPEEVKTKCIVVAVVDLIVFSSSIYRYPLLTCSAASNGPTPARKTARARHPTLLRGLLGGKRLCPPKAWKPPEELPRCSPTKMRVWVTPLVIREQNKEKGKGNARN